LLFLHTHVRIVKLNVILINAINCRISKRSRELIATHVNTPNIKRKTFIDRGMIAIVINVITNDAYEPIKSDNCKPSYLNIQNLRISWSQAW
jgi:hypothetical protein